MMTIWAVRKDILPLMITAGTSLQCPCSKFIQVQVKTWYCCHCISPSLLT